MRRSQDLSQEALGFRAHLHRNYLGTLERGEAGPTFQTLRKLADALGVPLSELIRLGEEYEQTAGRPALGSSRPD